MSKNTGLIETFLAAKEQIIITNSVVEEEIAFQYRRRKAELFGPVGETIFKNFGILKGFMSGQSLLEWVEPQGGCVCFPRLKRDLALDMAKFHDVLLNKYATYIGREHWFEEDV